MSEYHRGEIYYIYPRNVEYVNSEQAGGRPGIIVSNEVNNEFSRVVEVVFLTTRDKKPLPTHVAINSAKYPSTALCEQIDTIDKERIGQYINQVSNAEMNKIEQAMMISLEISTTIKGTKALDLWRKTAEEWEKDEETTAVPAGEIPVPASELEDVTKTPEYIRLEAERNVYKELYTDLLRGAKSPEGKAV